MGFGRNAEPGSENHHYATFAKPEIYECRRKGMKYANVCRPMTAWDDFAGLLARPVGRPSHEPNLGNL